MGGENALAANLGDPNLDPPNLAPDIIIRNLIFGTFVRATPCNSPYPNFVLKFNVFPCQYSVWFSRKLRAKKIIQIEDDFFSWTFS